MIRELDEIKVMVSGEHKSGSYKGITVDGVSIDTRTLVAGNLYVPIVRKKDGHDYVEEAIIKGAAAVLWDKRIEDPPTGIPVIFVDDTERALQALAKSYRDQLSARVIGITGSNGKTTVKDMLHSILATKHKVHKTQGNLNNHFGLPLTILGAPEDTEYLILEMGMSNAGEIALLSKISRPDVAIITMVGVAHIGPLGSREGIAKAKIEILEGMEEGSTLVYNGDEDLLAKGLARNKKFNKVTFGRENWNNIKLGDADIGSRGIEFWLNDCPSVVYSVPLLGEHNILNAMASIVVSRMEGIEEVLISKGLSDVVLSDMRLDLSVTSKGVTVINDAWNANPDSMKAAIDTLVGLPGYGNKVLVLGDMLELGESEIDMHRELGEYAKRSGLVRLFVLGPLSEYVCLGYGSSPGLCTITRDKGGLVKELNEALDDTSVVLIKGSRSVSMNSIIEEID